MAKTIRVDGEDIEIRPMTPERAAFMREACTHLGLATFCPFRVCRRNRRCGTKDVLCYQIMRQEVNAILRPALEAGLGEANTPDAGRTITPATRNAPAED